MKMETGARRPKRISRKLVLKLRRRGLTLREIAERLGCTREAVEYHVYPRRRETMRRYQRRYRKTEKYRKYQREYQRRRYHSDPEFRAKRLAWMKRWKERKKRMERQLRRLKEGGGRWIPSG